MPSPRCSTAPAIRPATATATTAGPWSLADPADNRWTSLLAVGAALFGPRPWWPPTEPDAQSVLLAGLVGQPVDVGSRPTDAAGPLPRRRAHPPAVDLGRRARDLVPVRRRSPRLPVDRRPRPRRRPLDRAALRRRRDPRRPGHLLLPRRAPTGGRTSARRSATTPSRSTAGTSRRPAARSSGPSTPDPGSSTVHADDDGSQRWVAEHDGYADLPVPAHHRRSLTLEAAARSLRIVDRVETDGDHALRLAFHLGPTVDAVVNGDQATLRWDRPDGEAGTARLFLPGQLTWKAHRGSDRTRARLVLRRLRPEAADDDARRHGRMRPPSSSLPRCSSPPDAVRLRPTRPSETTLRDLAPSHRLQKDPDQPERP